MYTSRSRNLDILCLLVLPQRTIHNAVAARTRLLNQPQLGHLTHALQAAPIRQAVDDLRHGELFVAWRASR